MRIRFGKNETQSIDTSIPVLILGGKENSLSLTRSLAKAGVSVSVSGWTDCWGLYSRFCSQRYRVPKGTLPKHYWYKLLLGNNPTVRKQHVILPCCDASIEFLAENESALGQIHIFDGAANQQRLALLDKLKTLKMAKAAGIGTPRFWPITRAAISAMDFSDCPFPVIIKPLNTFKFAKVFGQKFLTCDAGIDELKEKISLAHEKGFEVTVTEKIPGPDNLLSSYYTYVDDEGNFLFHFTKRVVRRYPINSGGGTYHVTQWLPETAKEGMKFFKSTGFRGLGNIEFKRDTRDGRLKIMEVNARFTAAQELVTRSGAPIDLIVYCHLTNQKVPEFTYYQNDLRYWYPLRDFLAFIQLKKAGQITFRGWLSELVGQRTVHPLIDSSDRFACFGVLRSFIKKAMGRCMLWSKQHA